MLSERLSQLFPFGSHEPPPPNEPPLTTPERRRNRLLITPFELPSEVQGNLSERDRNVINFLEEAAKKVATLYSYQENDQTPKANFYPPKVTAAQIEAAGRTNPEILSPYTIVTLEGGQLKAIPAHLAFKDQLRPISRLLRDAASQTKDMMFKIYLLAKATSFGTGNYETSERYWLERQTEPKIDIVIGLYDTYTDRFLSRKYAWQAWVGVLDEQLTSDSQEFLNAFMNWWRKESGQETPKVKMRVDHTIIQSGQAAQIIMTGNSLPCQIDWRRRYGSKFIVFEPMFEDRFNHEILPTFRSIISPNKRMGLPEALIKTVALRRFIAHEASHSLGIPEDVQKRLGKHTAWIKELYCDLLALEGYSHIEGLNPREREPEVALAVTLALGYRDHKLYHLEGLQEDYFKARSIILKYLLSKGNVRIDARHLDWDNHRQVYQNISELLNMVKLLMNEGNSKNADEFFKNYFDRGIYGRIVNQEPEPETPSQLQSSSTL